MTRTGCLPGHNDGDGSNIETELTADQNCLNCCRQLSVVPSEGDEAPFGAGVVAFDSHVKNAKTQVFIADAVKEIYSVLYAVDLENDVEMCALCVDCSLVFAQLFGLFQTFEARRKTDGFLDIALTKGIRWASDFTKNKTGLSCVSQETDGTTGQDDFLSEFEKFADGSNSENNLDSMDMDRQGNESADVITVQSIPTPEEPITDDRQWAQDLEEVNLQCDSDVDDSFPIASPPECDISDSNEADSEKVLRPVADSKSFDVKKSEVNSSSTGNRHSSSEDLKPRPRKSRRIDEQLKSDSNKTETAADVKAESDESDYAPTASSKESSDDDDSPPAVLPRLRKRKPRASTTGRRYNRKNITYRCADCPEEFHKTVILSEHRRNAHNTLEAFKCHICHKTFTKGPSLKSHLIRHQKDAEPQEKDKIFKCIDCGERFASASEFGRHRINLHGAESNAYVCHICLYNSKLPSLLKPHILRHISTEEHKCSECGKIFNVFTNMQDHMFRMHQVVVRRRHNRPFRPSVKVIIRCRKCSAEFDSTEKLFEHSAAQHGDELFHCEICKAIFFKKSLLSEHMLKHREPKLQCKFCDKKFHNNNMKSYHEINHHQDGGSTESHQTFSEAPTHVPPTAGTFQCTECPLAFDTENELSIHVKCRHKGVASFSCDVCSKAYITKAKLRLHQRETHGQSKCLKCNEMVKRGGMAAHFAQSHRRKVKPAVPPRRRPQQRKEPFEFPCVDCPEKFKRVQEYAKHRTTQHNVSAQDIYKCIYCHMKIGKNGISGAFRDHLDRHDESTDWPCGHCAMRFRKRTQRNEHRLQVHGPQPDDDPEGMLPLPPESTLQFVAGEKVHYDVRKMGTGRTVKNLKFKCVDCDQEFNRPLQLGNHRALLHGCEPGRRLQCHFCLQFKPTVAALYGHVRRHYAEPVHLCDVCPKTFRMPEDLKQHYRLNHTEDQQKQLREKWKRWRTKKAEEKRAEKKGLE